MNTVLNVFRLCRGFYEEICKPVSKSDRDRLLLKIDEFLAKREVLLKEMKGPYSLEEQKLGKQIIEYDQKIQEMFKSIKQEIQKDIVTTKSQKRNTPKYISPYPITNDGIYYDKRN